MSEAFFKAVKSGDAATVRAMLSADPSLAEARTKEGLLGAVLALYHGNLEVAQTILERKPRLDLHAAATVGDLPRVREFVEKDPSTLRSYSPDGFPPLGLAAYMGHLDLVDYLLSKGADVNQIGRNPAKFTALSGAVATRKHEVVRRLLDAGADPNYWYGGGFTPVLEAAAHGDILMLEMLLAHGGDVNGETEQGKTAVALALENGHPEAAEWLRAHGAED